MQENYGPLILLACLANTFKNKTTISKLDDVTTPVMVVGCIENSSKLTVQDFEKAQIFKVPLTSRHDTEIFPGVPDENLSNCY